MARLLRTTSTTTNATVFFPNFINFTHTSSLDYTGDWELEFKVKINGSSLAILAKSSGSGYPNSADLLLFTNSTNLEIRRGSVGTHITLPYSAATTARTYRLKGNNTSNRIDVYQDDHFCGSAPTNSLFTDLGLIFAFGTSSRHGDFYYLKAYNNGVLKRHLDTFDSSATDTTIVDKVNPAFIAELRNFPIDNSHWVYYDPAIENIVTVAPSGGNYTTVSAAFAACPLDLVSINTRYIIEVEDFGVNGLSDTVNVTGITTDSERYVVIRAKAGHEYNIATNTGVLITTSANYGSTIQANSAFTEVKGIKLKNTGFNASRALGGTGSYRRAIDMVLETTNDVGCRPIDMNNSDDTYLRNVLAIGGGDYGVYLNNYTYNAYLENVTSVNATSAGFQAGIGTNARLRNCLSIGAPAFSAGDGFNSASENNASDTATGAIGTGFISTATTADLVNYAGGDYRVHYTSPLESLDIGAFINYLYSYMLWTGGIRYAHSPTLGNILSSTKFKIETEFFEAEGDANLGGSGYWFSQAANTTLNREIGLFTARNASDTLAVYVGGTISTVLTSTETTTYFGSTLIKSELLSFELDLVTGAFTLKDNGTLIKSGTVGIGTNRIDGMNFMLGARSSADTPTTSGSFILAKGRIGNTKVYLNDTLVRNYVSNGVGNIWEDKVSASNATVVNTEPNNTHWIKYHGNEGTETQSSGPVAHSSSFSLVLQSYLPNSVSISDILKASTSINTSISTDYQTLVFDSSKADFQAQLTATVPTHSSLVSDTVNSGSNLSFELGTASNSKVLESVRSDSNISTVLPISLVGNILDTIASTVQVTTVADNTSNTLVVDSLDSTFSLTPEAQGSFITGDIFDGVVSTTSLGLSAIQGLVSFSNSSGGSVETHSTTMFLSTVATVDLYSKMVESVRAMITENTITLISTQQKIVDSLSVDVSEELVSSITANSLVYDELSTEYIETLIPLSALTISIYDNVNADYTETLECTVTLSSFEHTPPKLRIKLPTIDLGASANLGGFKSEINLGVIRLG